MNIRDKQGNHRCPFCGSIVEREKLRDGESRTEFDISGLCQGCQDQVFSEKDEL